ncbi:MAG: LacI family transcriptional regulator [Pseudomonadota bacterium]
MRRPTLKTLAQRLDLSVTTVSRALKDGPEVRPDTISRVKAAATELGYVPNLNGLKLKTGKTFTIYAMLAAPSADVVGDAGSVALLQGIYEVLASTPYSLTAVPLLPGMDDLAEVRRVVEAELADGILFDHTRPQDPRIKYLLEHDIPVVSFGRTELFSEHAYFDVDNEHASYVATKHLLAKGHRRIGLIDPELEFLFARQRLAGYRRALAEADVAFDQDLVRHTDLSAEFGREGVLRMRQLDDPPTGFVTANEVVSLGVISALRELGHRVGEGIDLVSRDGSRIMAFVEPQVASCQFPLRDAGRALASSMLRLLQGDPPEAVQQVARVELLSGVG